MAKILIVDDDLLNSKTYATKLESEGHQVTLSPDGESAQSQIVQKFDLILLDIMMPKIDGVALLGQIKKGVNRVTPVLVHTNLANKEVEQECLALGATEFLLKVDLAPTQLVEKIKSYLHGKI